jgi:Na+-driven multidrug efflux pump
MAGYGLLVTAILIWGGRLLISLFISEAEYIPLGIAYLRITSFCQIPQCLETVAASVFKGTGRTVPPSIVSIVSNALRALLAWILSGTALGVYGVWLGICLAAVIRGCWVFIWYLLSARSTLRGITPRTQELIE